jgi:hypothetical protein
MTVVIETHNSEPRNLIRPARRDQALRELVPKMLGIILAEGGKLRELGGWSVRLSTGLELSASGLGPNRIMLSVYSPSADRVQKVFSAHVTDVPSLVDPAFYRYADGSVGLMSWRRGEWETAVLTHPAQARPASELLSSGLLGTK